MTSFSKVVNFSNELFPRLSDFAFSQKFTIQHKTQMKFETPTPKTSKWKLHNQLCFQLLFLWWFFRWRLQNCQEFSLVRIKSNFVVCKKDFLAFRGKVSWKFQTFLNGEFYYLSIFFNQLKNLNTFCRLSILKTCFFNFQFRHHNKTIKLKCIIPPFPFAMANFQNDHTPAATRKVPV